MSTLILYESAIDSLNKNTWIIQLITDKIIKKGILAQQDLMLQFEKH
jgi:hypothetical protein